MIPLNDKSQSVNLNYTLSCSYVVTIVLHVFSAVADYEFMLPSVISESWGAAYTWLSPSSVYSTALVRAL